MTLEVINIDKLEAAAKLVKNLDGKFSQEFIDNIASISRTDDQIPNEHASPAIGRECYSFTKQENSAFQTAEEFIKNHILNSGENLIEGTDYSIETDAIGNMYIRIIGEDDSKTTMVGSHLDSVSEGGKYDGVAGISAGVEILKQAFEKKKQGKLKKSFTLTIFRSEESNPHNNGTACLGSYIATGTISKEKLEAIEYQDGVLLKDHIEVYYGEGTWKKVLELRDNPVISLDTVESYHELHIEQGKLTYDAEAQVGIVSGGIGGVKRYSGIIPSEGREEVRGSEYKFFDFLITGFSDHTGATPNNPAIDEPVFRKDALIGSAKFLEEFQKGNYGYLVSSTAPGNEKYTKVPFQQEVQLCIKKDQRVNFQVFYKQKVESFQKTYGVKIDSKSSSAYSEIKEAKKQVVSNTSLKKYIGTILGVAQVASDNFLKQKEDEDKLYGTTRLTMTDTHIDCEEGMKFKIDVREVDTDDVNQLMEDVNTEFSKILEGGLENPGIQKASEKPHVDVDETLRDNLAKVAEVLGYKSVFLPSAPGHDADRVGETGVPTAMVFVRQKEGVSHNPKEAMEIEDYNHAMKTMATAVLANIT